MHNFDVGSFFLEVKKFSNIGLHDVEENRNQTFEKMSQRNESVTHDTSSTTNLCNRFFSIPPQHPLRFLYLCAQVFLYYLGYGYLQVNKKNFPLKFAFWKWNFPGTFIFTRRIWRNSLATDMLSIFRLQRFIIFPDGIFWPRATKVICRIWRK